MFHIGIAVQHPPLPEPHQLSELGIDFIRQCLDIDPDKRPSAEELMLHPWIQEATAQISAAYEEESTPPGSYSKGTGSPAYDDSSYSQEPEGNSGTIAEEDEGEEEEYNHQGEDGDYAQEEDQEEGYDADGIAEVPQEDYFGDDSAGTRTYGEDAEQSYEASNGELGSLEEEPEEEEEGN